MSVGGKGHTLARQSKSIDKAAAHACGDPLPGGTGAVMMQGGQQLSCDGGIVGFL
jgi:hypothetical protein